jgi:hypothetical protein
MTAGPRPAVPAPPPPKAEAEAETWPEDEMGGPIMRAYLSVRALVARAVLGVLGWKFETTHTLDLTKGELNRFPPRWLVFGEPHTHLADIFFMTMFFWRYRLPKVSFPVAAEYFYPGLGALMRFMGAIPVTTGKNAGLVTQMAKQLRESKCMILHIPPSAAMRRKEYWRSGFYHIATQANVPVQPSVFRLIASIRNGGASQRRGLR